MPAEHSSSDFDGAAVTIAIPAKYDDEDPRHRQGLPLPSQAQMAECLIQGNQVSEDPFSVQLD